MSRKVKRVSIFMIQAFLNPAKAMVRLLKFDQLRANGNADQINTVEEKDLLLGLKEVAHDIPEFAVALDEFKKTLRKFGGKGE